LRGDFVKELSDAAIETHVAFAAKMPSNYSGVHLYPIDGAVRRQKPDSAAWGHRDVSWSLVIAGIDPDPAMVPRLKGVDAGLLAGGPSVQLAWRLCEFHDGR
jgi:hypothetical protein